MNCKDCYVEECTHRPFPNETECVFRQWTAKEPFDWQSFRAEAAKDILCALIPRYEGSIGNEVVEYAMFITDKLITKLKEKEA